jgi:tetratricopeptide (TPR) repeat protein
MRFIQSLAFVLIATTLLSQKEPGYKEYFQEGTYLLVEDQVEKARQNFEIAYRFDSTSANINYLLGVCYLQSPLEKTKAERYLAKAVKQISPHYEMDDPDERDAAPITHFYYAQALHVNYKFKEALEQFEAFRKYLDPKDKEYLKILTKEISTTKLAMEMVQHPINVQITNLGDSINSEYPEYSAVLSADERMIIYTTRRPTSLGGQKDDEGRYFEDIVVSYRDDQGRWTKPVSLSHNVNSLGHEACINLTPDGQTLIVFKNDEGKNPEGDGNLYYSNFDGKDWTPLAQFATNVNSEFWESHACLSADGNLLFFSSERPGGYGGKDIYRCVKLPNGQWSKALNMGPLINTEYDEDGGFIHPDGRTFYFASNGPKSMGGYDIMFATLNEDNKFSNATNIGYPINTTDDDIFYVSSPDGKRGYFSSAKAGGYGDKDIYRITIGEFRESFLALFKGQLIPAEGEVLPNDLVIIVTDKQSNEVIGTYRPRTQDGAFSTILPPGREYNFSYQTDAGEEFYNEDVFVSNDVAYQEIRREVALEPVRLGGKVRVKGKGITLNAVVLDNERNKRPVPGAKLVVEEAGGSAQIYDPDKNGKVNDIPLKPDKTYRVYTEINGKRSEVSEISTAGIKSAKIISQVVYLEGRTVKPTSKELLLDVIVRSMKRKRGVPDATIVLRTPEGEKLEYRTNKMGVAKSIELRPETKYELFAIHGDNASETITFTTGVIDGKRVKKTLFVRTLFVQYESPAEIAAAERRARERAKYEPVPGSYYKFTYKYGRKVINEKEDKWKRFIEYITQKTTESELVTIYIRSSASRVPTRLRGGNQKLAAIRGKNFELLIRSNLEKRGVDMKKVRFYRRSAVGGPRYIGDWKIGRKKYEKWQYVRGLVR